MELYSYDEDYQSQFSETAKVVSPIGNRVRKVRYKYTGSDPEPIFNGDSPSWTLQSDEFYVRDVSGKEIAIYSGSSLTQWNIWGLDNVGKINADTTRNYYLKDHLGSIRVVLNSTNGVVSAQDYDAWGYPLENRTYNTTAMKYDFTGKERDDETSYDYFGARYYDSRVANWTSIDPLFEKHFDFSPYNYVLRSPNIFIDPNGLQVFVGFTGWGLGFDEGRAIDPSEYSPTSETGSLQLAYDIQQYAVENKLQDFDMKFYEASYLGGEIENAKTFIQSNLDSPGEKVFLYGYSMGGININDLSKELQNAGIPVEILFTVDAYNISTSNVQEIPSNVNENWNFYQVSRNLPFGSRGNENFAQDPNETSIMNIRIENSDHKNIDERTNAIIYETLTEGIQKK